MKEIKIKSLELVNFKGIKDLKVDFNADITNILGRNGSGKTTIFDAITYALFGKDSKDRKEFNIKTLGTDGKAIERVPHGVRLELTVDGGLVALQKIYKEKWTKKRGSVTEEFTGHEEERYVNGVPCSVKEYAAKVADICDESVFKFITNPLYFTSQKVDVQREMLFTMAGGVSDQEVAATNSDFAELLAQLTGKTLEEYKREIAAKKRRIKDSVESIPARIEERKRDVPEAEDWKGLENEKAGVQEEIMSLESKLADMSERTKGIAEEKRDIYSHVADLDRDIAARSNEIRMAVQKEYFDKQRVNSEFRNDVLKVQMHHGSLVSKAEGLHADLERMKAEREKLLEEWASINAEKLVWNEKDFTCPMCGRKYDVDDIATRQEEMMANFKANKAERLENNKAKGLALRAKIEKAEVEYTEVHKDIDTFGKKIGEMLNDPRYQAPTYEGVQDMTDLINSDAVIVAKRQDREALMRSLEDIKEIPVDDSIRAQIDARMKTLSDLDRRLALKDVIARNNKRIAELENELATQSQELAELEGIEYTIAQFSKAKVEAIESRINSLFKVVRFKMFEQQINGGEVETCQATVNGVPFSDLNSAMKINAGLDIINAICGYYDVHAPIVIDNAESVNTLMDTQSQMIRLVVTEDEKLTII